MFKKHRSLLLKHRPMFFKQGLMLYKHRLMFFKHFAFLSGINAFISLIFTGFGDSLLVVYKKDGNFNALCRAFFIGFLWEKTPVLQLFFSWLIHGRSIVLSRIIKTYTSQTIRNTLIVLTRLIRLSYC